MARAELSKTYIAYHYCGRLSNTSGVSSSDSLPCLRYSFRLMTCGSSSLEAPEYAVFRCATLTLWAVKQGCEPRIQAHGSAKQQASLGALRS